MIANAFDVDRMVIKILFLMPLAVMRVALSHGIFVDGWSALLLTLAFVRSESTLPSAQLAACSLINSHYCAQMNRLTESYCEACRMKEIETP